MSFLVLCVCDFSFFPSFCVFFCQMFFKALLSPLVSNHVKAYSFVNPKTGVLDMWKMRLV